jgi:membrane-associated phospholipid phosphatase
MRLITCHKSVLPALFFLASTTVFAQYDRDSLTSLPVDRPVITEITPVIKKYQPVKPFSFITDVPGDLFQVIEAPFQKKNFIPLAITGAATTALFFRDESIIRGTGNLFRRLNIKQQESYYSHPFLRVGKVPVIKHPANVNTFFYSLGQPAPTFLLAGGFYIYGKITHSTRARRTASEITESFFTSLITVQTLKRVTGRQSPNKAIDLEGKWHWFPSLSAYNKDVTNYIAFPSGHMAAMMSAVTVVAQNYPEKKWIKPVGYSLISLTAFSMLNNKVHWASDFPLGLAIGYVSARIAHHRNQKNEKIKRTMPL